LTVLPEADAVAQDEFELAVGLPHVLPLGVTEIVPDPPPAATVRLIVFSVYVQTGP
jgi:hypothetical protein